MMRCLKIHAIFEPQKLVQGLWCAAYFKFFGLLVEPTRHIKTIGNLFQGLVVHCLIQVFWTSLGRIPD